MAKYDAVVVLSADNETTKARLEKALEIFYSDGNEFVLNGVNKKEKHDPGFVGDWPDDSRLRGFREEVEEIHPYALYARHTEANAYELAKLVREKRWKNFAVVSSETHMRRVGKIFYKFFSQYPEEMGIDYFSSPEPTERLRKRRVVKEGLAYFMTYLELFGLPRSKSAKTDEEIFKEIDRRKLKLDKINDLTKKILGLK